MTLTYCLKPDNCQRIILAPQSEKDAWRCFFCDKIIRWPAKMKFLPAETRLDNTPEPHSQEKQRKALEHARLVEATEKLLEEERTRRSGKKPLQPYKFRV